MASTVYTGKNQDFQYTNNTGGNVRVIIYWLQYQYNSNEYVKLVFGDLNGTSNDYIEYILANSSSSGGARLGRNIATYYQGERVLQQMISSETSDAVPLEIFLANGHVFQIDAQDNADIFGYNIVVIPEGG